ncbi:transcriptional regulator, LacI family [Sanguibacter gelidistatuariae]|uniref:Transcriptional regulator, LacI family n=1 Tax=Sanguibacter gelidistatuariae TaxID=1814289 RepID=A0A1G6VJI1_9MICO|nr:substrate-binding domain-containing protein [Sanguibacter gelidistatuariae]SDD53681.1 transcriptional regulator, LacI family [Sanguibacter gelidistatuariae]
MSTGAVGMVRTASRRVVGVEPFFMEFIAGAEEVLTEDGLSVLLAVVVDEAAELAMYARWAAAGTVDAVMVTNVLVDDPRPALLAELGVPAVAVGAWDGPPPLPSVRADDAAAMSAVAEYLLGLGHRSIAHVTGPATYLHTRNRVTTLDRVCEARGVVPVTVEGDYSDLAGARITRALLTDAEPPSVIVYDNDVMAVAGLHVAQELGIAVPADLSLVGWDDSALCQLTLPPLTTMTLDVHLLGRLVGAAVLATLAGSPPQDQPVVPARLSIRGSTAEPAAGR